MEDSDIANFLLLGIIVIFIVLSLLAHCLVVNRARRRKERQVEGEITSQEIV